METFSNIRFSVKHKKNVLIVVKNVKDIKKFLKFKGKPYLYLPVKKKISFSIRKKFNFRITLNKQNRNKNKKLLQWKVLGHLQT